MSGSAPRPRRRTEALFSAAPASWGRRTKAGQAPLQWDAAHGGTSGNGIAHCSRDQISGTRDHRQFQPHKGYRAES